MGQLVTHFVYVSRNIFQYKEKPICVYTSSPQEQEEFCHVEEVLDSIGIKILRADESNCPMLILPFSIGRNRQGMLNSRCIEKPIELFGSKGIEVHLVYLRREDARNLEDVDSMMRGISEKTIASREDYPTQGMELLQTVDEADP